LVTTVKGLKDAVHSSQEDTALAIDIGRYSELRVVSNMKGDPRATPQPSASSVALPDLFW